MKKKEEENHKTNQIIRWNDSYSSIQCEQFVLFIFFSLDSVPISDHEWLEFNIDEAFVYSVTLHCWYPLLAHLFVDIKRFESLPDDILLRFIYLLVNYCNLPEIQDSNGTRATLYWFFFPKIGLGHRIQFVLILHWTHSIANWISWKYPRNLTK